MSDLMPTWLKGWREIMTGPYPWQPSWWREWWKEFKQAWKDGKKS